MIHGKRRGRQALIILACGVIGAAPVGAAYVQRMNLRSLYENADRVLRATVIETSKDTIEAGGGRIPILRHRLRVSEGFRGAARSGEVVEIRMVDPMAGAGRSSGSARSLPLFDGLPRLVAGEEYLLFMTRPSRVGLSTTVGLGQGFFRIRGGRESTVTNELDNAGLFRGMSTSRRGRGPLRYSELAGEIRRLSRAR